MPEICPWTGLRCRRFHSVERGFTVTMGSEVEPMAVGDRLPDMPLFVEPNGCIVVPVESTRMAAYNVMPRRWRDVLDTQAVPQ